MKSVTDAQLLERIHRLPADKQAQVVDFIDFLAARWGVGEAAVGLPEIDDLVGKLAWHGDPVDFQRALRDEWQ